MRTQSARQTSKSNTEWSTPWLLVVVVWAWREIQNLQGYLKLDCQMIKEMRFSRAQSNRGIAGFALVWYRRQTITCVECGTPEFFFVKKISNYILLFEFQLYDVMYIIIYLLSMRSFSVLAKYLGWTFTFNAFSSKILIQLFGLSAIFFLDQNILVPYRGFFQIIDGITSFSNNRSALQLLNFKVNWGIPCYLFFITKSRFSIVRNVAKISTTLRDRNFSSISL